MPEHFRALAVILAIATTIFVAAKRPASTLLTTTGEFERRRNLWIGITLAAFLAHDFWIFMVLAAVLLFVASIKDENRVGLVLFILLAVPMMRNEVPGFAGIRYLFDLEYFRLISLIVLVPAFFQELGKNSWKYFYEDSPDKFLYAYLALNLILLFFAGTLTGVMRSGFLFFIDVFVPYAIASRLIKDKAALRSAFASYVIGAMIIAGVGVFEFSKSWLLYSTLEQALGVNWSLGSYLKRGDSLRALGTAGQAIPFGYAMAVGFCLLLGLRRYFPNKTMWLAGLGLLGLGLISSYSRGPWLGASAGFLVFALTGPHKAKNAIKLTLAAIALGFGLIASPMGDKLFDTVTVESGSYDYRERLLEISISVMLANPFFGAWDSVYSPAMQELKQGQGIIDIVNTYVSVALRCGLVGLFLFTGFFFQALRGVRRRMKSISDKSSEEIDLGRGLLAALTCMLVTIFTVSSITIVPVLYYLFSGLAVAYARMENPLSGESTTGQDSVLQSKITRRRPRAVFR